MPIVSNTSPILNLAIIGELQLLRKQFGAIGVLLLASKQGDLDSFQNSLDQLRQSAGFYIRKELYDRLIESDR